ncbi:hypothetical protein BDZ91DRAFT_750780 [Kalaharituber pfeilii]|nr:hypothetical protein BDZ91DRAFT_750780 [Kalaharituber pfeilii]
MNALTIPIKNVGMLPKIADTSLSLLFHSVVYAFVFGGEAVHLAVKFSAATLVLMLLRAWMYR